MPAGADVIVACPGSPAKTIRQLAGTAAISAGRLALPVYEMFKIGEDPHWMPGLDRSRASRERRDAPDRIAQRDCGPSRIVTTITGRIWSTNRP
jgi:hypothetical protein